MTSTGGYDPLLSVTSLPFGSHKPAGNLASDNHQTDEVFLSNLAEQLHRSSSPYSAMAQTTEKVETMLQKIPTVELRKIDETGREFESLLLFTMLKQMWETVPESSLFGNGMDSEIYREMWLEEISNKISSSGNGIGIADSFKWEMISRELQSEPPASILDVVS